MTDIAVARYISQAKPAHKQRKYKKYVQNTHSKCIPLMQSHTENEYYGY